MKQPPIFAESTGYFDKIEREEMITELTELGFSEHGSDSYEGTFVLECKPGLEIEFSDCFHITFSEGNNVLFTDKINISSIEDVKTLVRILKHKV